MLRPPGVHARRCQGVAEVTDQYPPSTLLTLSLMTTVTDVGRSHPPRFMFLLTFRFKEAIIRSCSEFSSAGFDETCFRCHLNTVSVVFTSSRSVRFILHIVVFLNVFVWMTFVLGATVVHWLALSPHNKKVVGSIPALGISVGSLRVP